ncbi:MAG: alkaline phosphatase family protein [Calditrichaeota bacterium]|nr:MAG: alkaline phosphatase family protein [Calditrichota bacterium]MBL1204397.1 alkaline phosphatase family protein [Calditrichota bacterium]NOG44226.1 alkaline phosphatase family protein [Calditrichota bacterium]
MRKTIILLLFIATQSVLGQSNEYLILISWDGCRWDYLNRDLTPNVQKLIDNGVRAKSLKPSFPSKTFPNHYTIVTGLYPKNHGIIFNRFTNMQSGNSYRIERDSSIHQDKWYKGETLWVTAKKHGIKSGVVFWPGSETNLKHPDYFLNYDHNLSHEKRVDQLMEWITYPEEKRPHLLLLYFPDTDDYGHEYGPDSEELNDVVKTLDNTLGDLIKRLKNAGIYEQTNIVLTSDHGMTNLYRENSIDIDSMLTGFDYTTNGNDPNLTFFADSSQLNQMFEILKKNEKGYTVSWQNEIPVELNYFGNQHLGKFSIMAKPGYYLKNKSWGPSKGSHGFDNRIKDMHGVFVAHGPAFKNGAEIEVLQNIDIYPLLCKALKIEANSKIDGKLNRVKHLLK